MILTYYASIMHNVPTYYALNCAGIFDGGLIMAYNTLFSLYIHIT